MKAWHLIGQVCAEQDCRVDPLNQMHHLYGDIMWLFLHRSSIPSLNQSERCIRYQLTKGGKMLAMKAWLQNAPLL